MQYEDDEGDCVILVADDDLVNAITYARLSGAKVLCSFWFSFLICLWPAQLTICFLNYIKLRESDYFNGLRF